MAMPETTMNENGSFVFRKDKIRFSWKFIPVDPVSKAGKMKRCTQEPFRFRVFPTDTGHHSRARFFVHDISHFVSLFAAQHAVFRCH
jgi:hypothetical protein